MQEKASLETQLVAERDASLGMKEDVEHARQLHHKRVEHVQAEARAVQEALERDHRALVTGRCRHWL